jgi:hypothetical protein
MAQVATTVLRTIARVAAGEPAFGVNCTRLTVIVVNRCCNRSLFSFSMATAQMLLAMACRSLAGALLDGAAYNFAAAGAVQGKNRLRRG